jgi:hypothetical protein
LKAHVLITISFTHTKAKIFFKKIRHSGPMPLSKAMPLFCFESMPGVPRRTAAALHFSGQGTRHTTSMPSPLPASCALHPSRLEPPGVGACFNKDNSHILFWIQSLLGNDGPGWIAACVGPTLLSF